MYQITGKTYGIRDQLKKLGFAYEASGKRWIGDEANVAALKEKMSKWSSGTWGVAINAAAKFLIIEEVTCETCEI